MEQINSACVAYECSSSGIALRHDQSLIRPVHRSAVVPSKMPPCLFFDSLGPVELTECMKNHSKSICRITPDQYYRGGCRDFFLFPRALLAGSKFI